MSRWLDSGRLFNIPSKYPASPKQSFLAGQGPSISYCMHLLEKGSHEVDGGDRINDERMCQERCMNATIRSYILNMKQLTVITPRTKRMIMGLQQEIVPVKYVSTSLAIYDSYHIIVRWCYMLTTFSEPLS